MSTEVINVGPAPQAATQLVSAGEGECLIQNGSGVTIYIGDSNSIQWNDPTDVVPLQPQMSVVLNGLADKFGCTQSVQGAIYKISDAVSIAGSSQTQTIYTQISNVTLPNDTSYTLGSPNPNPAYVGLFSSIDVSATAVSSSQGLVSGAPFVGTIRFSWFSDPQGQNLLFSEILNFYAGTASTVAQSVHANIPVSGAYLQVKLQNISIAGNLVFSGVYISGSFRNTTSGRCRQLAFLISPGTGASAALPNFPPVILGDTAAFSQQLGSVPNFVPGAGLTVYPLMLYSGPVWLEYGQSTAALNNVATIIDLSYVSTDNIIAGTAEVGVIWEAPSNTTSTIFQGMINLPRSPCALIANAAATSDINFSLVGQQGF